MSLEQTLVDALTSLIASLELTDDDDLNPDIAADIMEPVAAILAELSAEDRRRLTELATQSAESETIPARREIIEMFTDEYRLLPEEE